MDKFEIQDEWNKPYTKEDLLYNSTIWILAQENVTYDRKESELLAVVSWGNGLYFDRHRVYYKDVHNLSKTHCDLCFFLYASLPVKQLLNIEL